MSENSRLAQAILSQLTYITLSTATTDGVPWNAPVYAAFDEAYTFFWVSAKYARHSQNIRANQRIAIVVLTDSLECSHALACLRRRGWEHPPSVDMVVGATLRGVYKAVPENIWISTEDSNGLDGRVQVDVLEM